MSGEDNTTRNSGTNNGGGNSIKILNDECITPRPKVMPTSVPLSPPKHMNLSIAKSKTRSSVKEDMDHYVLQTVKGETNGEGDETIAFVLSDKKNETQEMGTISGEITEELQLSCEDEDSDGNAKTEEIVEHVCGKCYKTFRRFNGLKKHMDFCRFDSGYHLRKAEMLKNLEKIEKDAVVMENKDICFCCGESYDTFHLGHINCPDCPKSFKSQMSYERHIFITHSEFNDFPCSICNAKLRTGNLLKLHEEQHKNRGKPFACKICGKDFTRAYHLNRHQKYSSCSASETDSMTCKVCDKVFFRLDNLRAHLKLHLGTHVSKKPEYRCPQCKNCFYSLSTLNIHTRTHTGERPFDCDLCEKKFPSLVALKKHRRYHTGEKPYTCSVCNASFAVKEVLNRHMKRHTGERPHSCSECGKSFIQATQLRNHAKTHIRPFECTQCGEKFKTDKQLERHAKTHNRRYHAKSTMNEPLSECGVCGVFFKQAKFLERHMAKGDHRKVLRRNRRLTTKIINCEKCEMQFDSVRNLEFHMLKMHEEESMETSTTEPGKSDTAENVDAQKQPNSTMGNIHILHNVPTNVRFNETNISNNGGVVVQEFIIDEIPTTSNRETIILQNEAYTVIPLESDGVINTVTTNTMPVDVVKEVKKEPRKSLAESLAEAIADDEDSKIELGEDLKLKENIGKLLDMLVDTATLKKFGWPNNSEENVLCKVIENCGHDLSKDSESYRDCDYGTRMREYVKLLFTVVIHNDSIKELLNNYPIDEVVEYVLGNDDDDDGDEEMEQNEDNKAKKN